MAVKYQIDFNGLVRTIICLFIFLTALPAAYAFKLTPITKEFAPSGRGARQTFQLENNSEDLVAVQVSMLTREMDVDGRERNLPADDDFIVFPSQVLLRPGQIQTVRVQWAGDGNPSRELSYRILAEQLPVEFSREPAAGARINVVLRYLGSVYIVPNGAIPEVAIASVTSRINEDDKEILQIVIRNQGTAHAILRELKLTLQAGETTVELGPGDLQGIAGENLLAGSERHFVVGRPDDLPAGPVKVGIDFRRRR